MIVQMIFLPMTAGYINTSLTCNILSRAIVKACMIVQLIFLPMTDGCINTSLTFYIQYGAIYNLQFNPIKWWNNITRIIWNNMFNACIESRKYFSNIFACIVHNNPKVFKIVRYINIYFYNTTQVYQYFILPYCTCD